MRTAARAILFTFGALGLVGCGPQGQANSQTENASANTNHVVFINAHLITMQPDGEPVLRDQQLWVENDRIRAIGTDIDYPAGVTVIDVDGGYLMPGLGEMHGHVPPAASFEGIPERYTDDVLQLYLAGGVTTVRGMLGYPHQLSLKQAIANGEKVGPTLYLAGPSFSGNSIESTEQAVRRVVEQAEQGWDLLKIHPGLSWAEYSALTAEAKVRGIEFAGHVPEEVGLDRALAAGQRTIDHLDGYMLFLDATERPISQAQLQRGVQETRLHGAGIVPTQALWETLIGAADADALRNYDELQWVPAILRERYFDFLDQPENPYRTESSAQVHAQNRQKLLKALYDAGVPIYFGTDAPQLFSVPGLSVPRELNKMAEAGIDNYGILVSATRNVGDYFANQDQFGQLREGYRADLVWTQTNPLDDLTTLTRPQGVMARGHWYSRATLDQQLADIAAAYAE